MAKKAELSTAWIEAGLHKLRAKFSNLVCFETDDRERFHQLLHFLPQHPGYQGHQIYLYDRWQGLCRHDSQKGAISPVPPGEGDRFAVNAAERAGLADALRDPAAALRHMDLLLKTKPSLLLLQDLESIQEMDRDPQVIHALRSWSQDTRMAFQGSAVILMASQAEAVLDHHTLARTAVIPVDLSLDTERAFIIVQAAQELELAKKALSQVGALVRLTAGLSLHQLRTVMLESIYRTNTLDSAEISRLKSELIKREKIVDVVEPAGGFEMVGGYETVKQFVREEIIRPLREPERTAHFGVPSVRGCLLLGPPGTGKSLFARSLAGECHLPFIRFNTENLYSQFLGGSGKNFAKAIEIAEKHGQAIVFIDEIDKLGRRRSSATDGASEETHRVLNQILEWLADPKRQTIVVGTTNRPGDLDRALIRPQRLSYLIPFLYPDSPAREQILKIHLGMTGVYPLVPVQHGDELNKWVEYLVKHTQNYSGAELEELSIRIRRLAFRRSGQFVEYQDVQEALQNFTVNQEARLQEIRSYGEIARDFSNEARFFAPQG